MQVDCLIEVSVGNRVPTFLEKSCQFYLSFIHFVAALMYLSVFPFGVEGLMWIWLYQFQGSLIY